MAISTPSFKSILFKAVLQAPAIVLMAAALALSHNHFRTDRLPLVCSWKGNPADTHGQGEAPVISVDEAAALFKTRQVVFVDARPESYYREGHIQGAISLPWQEAEEKYFNVMESLDPNVHIVTYCDGAACDLCHKLAAFLCDLGFAHVSAMVNGWTVWNQHRLPVETGNPT